MWCVVISQVISCIVGVVLVRWISAGMGAYVGV
jgi:hypothetical protein